MREKYGKWKCDREIWKTGQYVKWAPKIQNM